METLTHPPFASNPPVKFNLSASTLGLILFILGCIGIFFGFFGAVLTLVVTGVATAFGGVWTLFWGLGTIISLIGTVVTTLGAWKMYKNDPDGKRLAIMGVGINLIGALLASLPVFIGFIFSLIINGIIYYLIVISRFPNEPQLVATQMPYGGQPPYGQQPPMQQPPQSPYGGGQPPMPPQNPPQQ